MKSLGAILLLSLISISQNVLAYDFIGQWGGKQPYYIVVNGQDFSQNCKISISTEVVGQKLFIDRSGVCPDAEYNFSTQLELDIDSRDVLYKNGRRVGDIHSWGLSTDEIPLGNGSTISIGARLNDDDPNNIFLEWDDYVYFDDNNFFGIDSELTRD
ncbi:MAG: hypothetical protein KDD25_07945 [Bdellovibrionales bacterium]|nr:hypothetical protein [Bdellovibrionales bacterium]